MSYKTVREYFKEEHNIALENTSFSNWVLVQFRNETQGYKRCVMLRIDGPMPVINPGVVHRDIPKEDKISFEYLGMITEGWNIEFKNLDTGTGCSTSYYDVHNQAFFSLANGVIKNKQSNIGKEELIKFWNDFIPVFANKAGDDLNDFYNRKTMKNPTPILNDLCDTYIDLFTDTEHCVIKINSLDNYIRLELYQKLAFLYDAEILYREPHGETAKWFYREWVPEIIEFWDDHDIEDRIEMEEPPGIRQLSFL